MKTNEITYEHIKILCWGDFKSGKTVFAGTAPRPYFFDLDNGMLSLSDHKPPIEFETYIGEEGYKKFKQDMNTVQKRDDIDTIVIDSLSSLQDVMMSNIQRVNGTYGNAPQIQEYGLYMIRMRRFLFDLVAIPKHVILSAHEQIFQDGVTQEVFITPLVFGKDLPKRLGLWFDEVYHTETERDREGKIHYYIRTKPSRRHNCGSRLNCLEELEVPDFKLILEKIKKKKGGKKSEN